MDVTPAQTIGPFFHDGLLRDAMGVGAPPAARAEAIAVEGHVYDGNGDPVDDAMIEIWQPDHEGSYRHPSDRWDDDATAFVGFARVATNESGRYRVETVMPGTPAATALISPARHINIHVFARGLLDRLATRAYFEDDAATATDTVLQGLTPARRHTLIARLAATEPRRIYHFDVWLQGDHETVFFDI